MRRRPPKLTTTGRMAVAFLIAAVLVGVILYAANAEGACKPSDYGCAEFDRRDGFPQDGKCLDFSARVNVPEGDLLNRAGDLESWDGAEGGCSACPANTLCSCTPDSDITQETAVVRSGGSSAKFVTDASNNVASFYFEVDLEPDSAYVLSWWTYGTDGTEDMYVSVQTSTQADRYYDDATDVWQAGFTSSFSMPNIGAGWSLWYGYVLTDSVDRSGSRILISRNGASQTWYLDDVQIHKLPAIGPEFATRELFTPLVTSDPGVDCKGATGCYAVYDGDDVFERDSDGTFNPAANTGRFSALVRYKLDAVPGTNEGIIGKWTTSGNQRAWTIRVTSGSDIISDLSDDGTTNAGHYSSMSVHAFTPGAWSSALLTYAAGVDGAASGALYVNNETPDTDSTLDNPIHPGTGPLYIGGRNTVETIHGAIAEVCYWDRSLSTVEAAQAVNPFYGATNHGDGMYVVDCNQAASHAACGSDGCVDWSPNSCWPDEASLPLFDQYTTELDNTDLSWGVDAPAGFTKVVSGTGTVTQYFGDRFDGDSSMRLKGADGDVARVYNNDCITAPAGSDTTFRVQVKALAGANLQGADRSFTLRATFYTGGACTTTAVTTAAAWVSVGGDWQTEFITLTAADWAAYTGVRFHIWAQGNGSAFDYLVDAVNVTESSYPVPYISCPEGSGTCTFSARDLRVHNPLSDTGPGGAGLYADGFCTGGWVWTPWGGDNADPHYLTNAAGTAGNNNRWWLVKDSNPYFTFYAYDSTGDNIRKALSGTAANWTAGAWKYFEACTDNAGTIDARHYNLSNDTWYTWSTPGGTGSGVMDGANSQIRIGNYSGASLTDGYYRGLAMCPYESPFPKCGWGQGPPTRDPY